MAKPAISTKRLQIDKANSRVVVAAGVAAFILIFSAVAVKTLISQATYQNRVISAKRATLNQLNTNIAAVNTLKESYATFNSANPNILGGNSAGSGPVDGTNPNLILSALPSSYDFPALANSLEKLVASQGVEITSITGTDDQVAQQANQTSSTPTPAEIPFQMAVTGNYQGVQNVLNAFDRSIRPVQVQSLVLAASDGDNLSLTVTAKTYYQPGKSLNITTEAIK